VFYKQVIDKESYNANSVKLFPYDTSDNYENSYDNIPKQVNFNIKSYFNVIVRLVNYFSINSIFLVGLVFY
jgi:hypothetical protein